MLKFRKISFRNDSMTTFNLRIFFSLMMAIASINCQIYMNATLDSVLVAKPDLNRWKTLSMMATLNYKGFNAFGPICSKSIEMVYKTMMANPNWLPGYNFTMELIDDNCDNTVVIRECSRRMLQGESRQNTIPFVQLGACTADGTGLVAQIMKQTNFIGTTWSFSKPDYMEKPEKYNAVYQAIGQAYDRYYSLLQMFQHMGWRKVAIFSDDDPFFNNVENEIQKIIQEPDINVTITFIGPKLANYGGENVKDVIKVMDELKGQETRIIIGHTNKHVDLSCWLYRYGMYGPQYVVLGTKWRMFNPDQAIIPDYLPWCTIAMLKDVVGSWIYFGTGNPVDIYGSNYTDSLGNTNQEVVNQLEQEIIDITSYGNRDVWWRECYDSTIITLSTVGEAERILQQKYNSTLSEWTIDSENYDNNGQTIVEIFREAIHQIEVRGSSGFYNYNPITMKNSDGFKPEIFYQPRYEDNERTSLVQVPVSYYKSNDRSLVSMNGGFLFGGSSKIPNDNVLAFSYEVSLLPDWTYILICTLSLVGISSAIVFLVLLHFQQGNNLQGKVPLVFRVDNSIILIGIVVLLIGPLLAPLGMEKNVIAKQVKVLLLCSTAGFSTLTAGLMRKIFGAKNEGNYKKSTKVKTTRIANICSFLMWPLIQTCLSIALISVGTFDNPEQVEVGRHYSDDKAIVYKSYQFSYISNVLAKSQTSFLLFISLIISQGVGIFSCLFGCYDTLKIMKGKLGPRITIAKRPTEMRSSSTRPEVESFTIAMKDFQMTSLAVYCTSVLIGGFCLISLIMMSKSGSLLAITLVATIVISYSYLGIVFVTKLFEKAKK